VSHDRAFLDRSVDEALVIDGSGVPRLAPGGYAGWLASRRTPAGPGGPSRPGAPAATGPGHDPGAPRAVRAGAEADGAPKGRSPSTLRRLVTQAERALAAAERQRDALAAELSEVDPTDHGALRRLSVDLAEADAAVLAAEEAWLEV